MGYSEDIKNLLEDILEGNRERKELLSSLQQEVQELRERTFMMLQEMRTEFGTMKSDLWIQLAKGESDRKRDFRETMEGILEQGKEIKREVAELLADSKAEREAMSAEWKRIAEALKRQGRGA